MARWLRWRALCRKDHDDFDTLPRSRLSHFCSADRGGCPRSCGLGRHLLLQIRSLSWQMGIEGINHEGFARSVRPTDGSARLPFKSAPASSSITRLDQSAITRRGALLLDAQRGGVGLRDPKEERGSFSGFPALIEETVLARIQTGLSYASWPLDHIDAMLV